VVSTRSLRSLLNQRRVGFGSLLNQRREGLGSLLNQRREGLGSLLSQQGNGRLRAAQPEALVERGLP
jgi:hypothetical protein